MPAVAPPVLPCVDSFVSFFSVLSLRIPLTLARLPARTMDNDMSTFDAFLFPAEDRPPHVVPLACPEAAPGGALPLWPRPAPQEVYMDYIPDQLGSWRYHVRPERPVFISPY